MTPEIITAIGGIITTIGGTLTVYLSYRIKSEKQKKELAEQYFQEYKEMVKQNTVNESTNNIEKERNIEEIKKLKSKIADLELDIKSLKEEVSLKNKELEDKNKQLDTKNEMISELQLKIIKLNEELNTLIIKKRKTK